jgi:hypothetical protein
MVGSSWWVLGNPDTGPKRQNPTSEYAAEHSHRREERIARMYPALMIWRQPTGRDHAMGVGMIQKVLSPRVKDAEETDLGAKMLGIGGDLQQTGSTGAEQ